VIVSHEEKKTTFFSFIEKIKPSFLRRNYVYNRNTSMIDFFPEKKQLNIILEII
jgi:hypothetical protein